MAHVSNLVFKSKLRVLTFSCAYSILLWALSAIMIAGGDGSSLGYYISYAPFVFDSFFDVVGLLYWPMVYLFVGSHRFFFRITGLALAVLNYISFVVLYGRIEGFHIPQSIFLTVALLFVYGAGQGLLWWRFFSRREDKIMS